MTTAAQNNIFHRIHAVANEVAYVQKKVATGSGSNAAKGVARDDVVAEVRPILLKHGVIAYTSQVEGRFVETTAKSSSGTPLMIYVGKYRTTFQCIETCEGPSSFYVEHEAQGNDYGDKGPGKASTYAEKLNIVKGLMLETGIADEGRNPGDGDQPDGGKAAATDKPSIKPPKAQGAPAADAAAEDNTPASPGLIKMLKAEAEAKGIADIVLKKLEKAGHSWESMPKSVAVKARAQVEAAKAPQREPGEEG